MCGVGGAWRADRLYCLYLTGQWSMQHFYAFFCKRNYPPFCYAGIFRGSALRFSNDWRQNLKLLVSVKLVSLEINTIQRTWDAAKWNYHSVFYFTNISRFCIKFNLSYFIMSGCCSRCTCFHAWSKFQTGSRNFRVVHFVHCTRLTDSFITNKRAVLLLCISLLISCYMFRVNWPSSGS
jgi:hypothetical protein